MSYSDTVYVSENNIYVTRGYTETEKIGDTVENETKTDISIMSYADSLSVLGTIKVSGPIDEKKVLVIRGAETMVVGKSTTLSVKNAQEKKHG